jgi:type IV secretion system protein VirB10
MMNAPNGQAGGVTTGMPGASILVVPTIGQALQSSQEQTSPAPAVVLPAGTKILLTIKNAVDTRSARVGDAVYLQSSFPVVVGDRVALPAGTYVQGKIDAVKPAGKRVHRAEVRMHCTTMVLRNGRVVSIPGPNNAREKDKEGMGQATSGKGSDAWAIAQGAEAGDGISTMAGAAREQTGKGPLTSSHAGTDAGLECSVFAKGNAVVIPRGTSVEMVLQGPLALGPKQNSGQPSPAGQSPNYGPSPNQHQPM